MDQSDSRVEATEGWCRSCGAKLRHTFLDLGMSPLCESNLEVHQLDEMESFFPLRVFVCERCFLVQLKEYVAPEKLFTEYAYFSSYSDSWLDHAKVFADQIVERFSLNAHSQVVEIASNDGYLLQYFLKRQIPVLGIEPAFNVASVAIQKGIPTITRFFGEKVACELAADNKQGDLLIGNNVLAQVPDLNTFVRSMKIALKSCGVITMEFPHLLRLIEGKQFDTIYHEHFSYFSLLSVDSLFSKHGLVVFDVEELASHGGSLRIYACHSEDATKSISGRVSELRAKEEAFGLRRLESYFLFEEKVRGTKRKLLEFLIRAKQEGKRIVGYGAPGKGNTLLNYCGIRTDFIDYTVDRNPYKQGKFTPGSHIPICHPSRIAKTRPDYLLVLPWNLKEEIMAQMAYIREWGGKFLVPIPEVESF